MKIRSDYRISVFLYSSFLIL